MFIIGLLSILTLHIDIVTYGLIADLEGKYNLGVLVLPNMAVFPDL